MSKRKDWFKYTYSNQTHGYHDFSPKRVLFIELGVEFAGKSFLRHNLEYELIHLGIRTPFKKWNIELTETDTRPLKFEIEFNPTNDLTFAIGQEDFVEKVLKQFGNREIVLGNQEFDKHYITESNKAVMVIKVFSKEVQNIFLTLIFIQFLK